MKDSILLERLNQSELGYLDRELLLNTHWSGGICPTLRCLSQYMLARLFPHFWIDYVPSRLLEPVQDILRKDTHLHLLGRPYVEIDRLYFTNMRPH